MGVIRPTFEEYPNRYSQENEVVYIPENDDFSYNADDVMNYFGEHPIENLLIINPDNPSGNYIQHKEILRIIDWTKKKKIRLIVDESFVDFSDEEECTLLSDNILNLNPHLFVMKSISKSYGVPGLRLGIMASGDKECIAEIKKDVAIWNINSFAEFYMQIEEKYHNEYMDSLKEIRSERRRFVESLETVPGTRVIPSQANYVMIELTNEMTAKRLTKMLLVKHYIFIKDLSSKIGRSGKEYIRVAVRNREDNDLLIDALRQELGKSNNL